MNVCKKYEEKEIKELQSLINICIKENENIKYKVCNSCKRELPAHFWFFNEHNTSKDGLQGVCRECKNKVFINPYKKTYWFEGNENEIKDKFRYMSIEQLMKHFKVTESQIKTYIYRYNLTNDYRLSNLSEEDVIYIYKSLLIGERKSLPNGFQNNKNNIYIIIRYLFLTILGWNSAEAIYSNFKYEIFDRYKLKTLGSNGYPKSTIEYVIEAFPEFNLKRWQFSDMGYNYWNDTVFEEFIVWFKDKLINGKCLENIYDAYKYGFENLLKEFNCNNVRQYFNNAYVHIYEKVYNEKFIKAKLTEDVYNIKIDTKIKLNKNLIIKPNYYELDDIGKTLINCLVKFYEKNFRIPRASELCNNNNLISYVNYKKYFDSGEISTILEKYVDISNYKPEYKICEECGKSKPFTSEFFRKNKKHKYGTTNICKDCDNKRRLSNSYKSKGIIFDNIEDISPEKWWDFINNKQIKKFPNICFDILYIRKIFKYVIVDKLNLKTKEEMCKYIAWDTRFLKKYHLYIFYIKYNYNLYYLLKDVFVEYNLEPSDLTGKKLTYDGFICDSFEERDIYNYIKFDLKLEIIHTGTQRKNGFYNHEYKEIYYPDFLIKGKNKDILVEHFGLYIEDYNGNSKILKQYSEKTKRKINFFGKMEDYFFLSIFPEDLKNNMQGVREKLTSFFMLNFNIDIRKIA